MSELVLSASSIESYQVCPYRWYLQYVEQHQGQTSIEAAVGSAVHAGAEVWLKAQMLGMEPSLPEAIETHDFTYFMELEGVVDTDENPAKMRAIGRRVLTAYVEDIAPRTGTIMVEHAGRMLVNGIALSYHIDRVTEIDEVLDLKVKKAKPRTPADYLNQLIIYALGFRAETGRRESDVGLDVMIRLKRDRPYLVPIRYGGPVSDRDIGVFARTLDRVADGIERSDWSPLGIERDDLPCRWCPVRSLCEPWARLKAISGGS